VSRLPVRRASRLDAQAEERRWLIEELWAAEAVGVLGGEPKCCKSLCALGVAVSVASGAPCLGRFVPAHTGRVLLYAAEDPLHVVRARLEAICRASSVDFETLDVHVITAPSVRIDLEADRELLSATVEAVKPTLLILDPFVRLHRIDENAVAEVAPVLAYLRQLQRRFGCAVLLVHHARKGAGGVRGGQALRGSSELHAIGDSNLYLRRRGAQLLLSVEHRAARSVDDIPLELHVADGAPTLRVATDGGDEPASALHNDPDGDTLADRIVAAIADAGPMTPRQLRAACRVRMARVYRELRELAACGRVAHTGDLYRLG
jgi:hypothetical protein